MAGGAKYDDFFKQLTLDQTAVFLAVYRASTNKESLADLSRADGGRDIGGYLRTVKRLNDQSKRYFGEPLLHEPYRKGAPWTPTATGRLFADLCGGIHECIDRQTNEIERLAVTRPIRVAMPPFPLMDMLHIEDLVNRRLVSEASGRRFEKQLVHIRSEQFPVVLLDNPEIDFAFGGLITPEALDDSLEFAEIDCRRYNLIANFDLPTKYGIGENFEVTAEFLREKAVPLIIAHAGVIFDFLLATLGIVRNRKENIEKYRSILRQQYNIVEECNDVHFIIDLICTARHNVCMLGTPDIFLRAKDRVQSNEIVELWNSRGARAPEVSYHRVTSDLPPLHIGVLRRRPAEVVSLTHDREHPYRIFWEAVQQAASTFASGRKC